MVRRTAASRQVPIPRLFTATQAHVVQNAAAAPRRRHLRSYISLPTSQFGWSCIRWQKKKHRILCRLTPQVGPQLCDLPRREAIKGRGTPRLYRPIGRDSPALAGALVIRDGNKLNQTRNCAPIFPRPEPVPRLRLTATTPTATRLTHVGRNDDSVRDRGEVYKQASCCYKFNQTQSKFNPLPPRRQQVNAQLLGLSTSFLLLIQYAFWG